MILKTSSQYFMKIYTKPSNISNLKLPIYTSLQKSILCTFIIVSWDSQNSDVLESPVELANTPRDYESTVCYFRGVVNSIPVFSPKVKHVGVNPIEMKILFLTDNSTENAAFGLQLNGFIHFSLLNVTPSQSVTCTVGSAVLWGRESCSPHSHI